MKLIEYHAKIIEGIFQKIFKNYNVFVFIQDNRIYVNVSSFDEDIIIQSFTHFYGTRWQMELTENEAKTYTMQVDNFVQSLEINKKMFNNIKYCAHNLIKMYFIFVVEQMKNFFDIEYHLENEEHETFYETRISVSKNQNGISDHFVIITARIFS